MVFGCVFEVSIKTTKRLASRITGAGESRICIYDAKAAKEALTADDVRELLRNGAISVRPVKGTGRAKARFKQSRKEAGRRRGEGSRRGSEFAKTPPKKRWAQKVRSQRRLLSNLKPRLSKGAYRELYSQVKGNLFKSKKALLSHAVSKGHLK
jgi:large subunit ribosomal protein L19e